MRKEIERVISELHKLQIWHERAIKSADNEEAKCYHGGVFDGIEKGVSRLREVVANEQTNNSTE